MRGRYGTDIKVLNDIEEHYVVTPADVVLSLKGVDGDLDALLDPETARKLAKKLVRHARRVERANLERGFDA